ncbi:MAG: hypothetical protein WC647_04035 [Desulfomonilaceae bacterium]|jgi:hypothetical protein
MKRETVSATSDYTRQDAVEDGFLIDISARYPKEAAVLSCKELYVTDRVWKIVEQSADNPNTGSSREGILWDIMWVGLCSLNQEIDTFNVGINGIEGQEVFPFRFRLIWDENNNPGGIIMLPAEDTHDRPILF